MFHSAVQDETDPTTELAYSLLPVALRSAAARKETRPIGRVGLLAGEPNKSAIEVTLQCEDRQCLSWSGESSGRIPQPYRFRGRLKTGKECSELNRGASRYLLTVAPELPHPTRHHRLDFRSSDGIRSGKHQRLLDRGNKYLHVSTRANCQWQSPKREAHDW